MENELINKKMQFYYDRDISIHINLTNEKFKNGKIVYVGADFILLREFDKEGKKVPGPESPIFFMEIKEVDIYKAPSTEFQ